MEISTKRTVGSNIRSQKIKKEHWGGREEAKVRKIKAAEESLVK